MLIVKYVKRRENHRTREAGTRRCSVKKFFWKVLQNSQENTCVEAYNFIKKRPNTGAFFEICKIFKKTFFYRPPSVAASATITLRINDKRSKVHKQRVLLQIICLPDWLLNTFVSNAPFLYSLKTSVDRKVFWCFPGVEKGCIGNKWVNKETLNVYLLMLS